jgi:serine/threonine protein kinase
MYISQLL